jgi:queuosine precursor transporter
MYLFMKKFIYKYPATLSYILFIIVLNILYTYLPPVSFLDNLFSPANIMVGAVYIFRDFAQREIRHYVLIAMLLGAMLSYLFAAPSIAVASFVSFIVAETIEWIIFTWTKKPLSQRLLWSASISVPIDSLVFLWMIYNLNGISFSVQTASKMIGVLLLWGIWKYRQRAQ